MTCSDELAHLGLMLSDLFGLFRPAPCRAWDVELAPWKGASPDCLVAVLAMFDVEAAAATLAEVTPRRLAELSTR